MKMNLAFFFVSVFVTSSCVFINPSDTCRFASHSHIYKYDPEALMFVVGYPSRPNPETPYLELGSSSDAPDLTVVLASLDERYEMPPELDSHRCKNVEFHAFDLEVDSEDWGSYWTAAKDRGDFSIGVVFPDLEMPVRLHSIGFAFVDKSTQESVASCGCLGQ